MSLRSHHHDPPSSTYSDYPEEDNLHQQDAQDAENMENMENVPGSITDRYFDRTSARKATQNTPMYRKTWFWLVAAGVILVVGVIGTSVGLARSSNKKSPSVGVELPKPELDATNVNSNRNELGQILLSMYTERGMDWEPVGQLDTFQGRALTFVAGASTYAQLSRAQNIERYALVVFYLYTFRQPHLLLPVASPWTSSQNWLTKESVCVWEGIVCNDDDSVQQILLPNHELSGSLPPELCLLLNLETIDFTTNFIYMDSSDHFLWTLMGDLLELTMDDNYFIAENGLPAQFRGLTSIQKISLSYNLLQGTFDGDLFGQLQTLQHLEIESNYIEGPLPDELLLLESLIYLYVRRNSLEIDLDKLLAPTSLPNIFALWIDANNIGGTIPAAIGQKTELASLSITDADLTGSLPTEMGLLVNMRRCWLYDNALTGAVPAELAQWGQLQVLELYGNELTGTMPQAVCDAVGASEYEFRTLSVDCSEVTCNDCCTECL